ncbi:MAG: hypothetical protein ACK4Q5_02270 [Saprospiraceae bacterium]
MNTVTIPESEFLKLQIAITEMQKSLLALEQQVQVFSLFFQSPQNQTTEETDAPRGNPHLTWQFGAGQHLITHMADDFNAPLEELEEYMQ